MFHRRKRAPGTEERPPCEKSFMSLLVDSRILNKQVKWRDRNRRTSPILSGIERLSRELDVIGTTTAVRERCKGRQTSPVSWKCRVICRMKWQQNRMV